MKKLLILLSIILLTKITAFSSNISIETKQDSIVYITPINLKYTNLIFAEHDKFLKENTLLKTQLDNYKNLNEVLIEVDSLRLNQIQEYNILNKSRLERISNLEAKIEAKDKTIKYWKIGGITVSIGLLLFVLFK